MGRNEASARELTEPVLLSLSKDARRGLCPRCFDGAQHDNALFMSFPPPQNFAKFYNSGLQEN